MSAFRDAVLAHNPTLFYLFGEGSGTNANDETANNNDGTYSGSGVTYGVTGPISGGGTAVTLSGTGSEVVHPGASIGGGALTYLALIKPSTIAVGDYCLISNKNTALVYRGTTVRWYSDADLSPVNASHTFNTSDWFLVWVTQTGTSYSIGVNAVSIGTGTAPALDNGGALNKVGAFSTVWRFSGSIAAAAIIPSVLSEAQMAAIHAAITASDTTPPTLSAATTNGAGSQITATISEPGCTADGGGSSGSGGFTLSGTSATVSGWSISGTTLTLTLSGSVVTGETVTYSYARSSTTDDIKDAGGNYLANFSGASVTNATTETTAPILSSPVGTETGSTTATIGATTDEANGTLYGVVTTSSTPPSATQVKAGQDHTGAAAAFAGSTVVSSVGAKTINATGLSVSTAYRAHLMHEDAAGNKSNVVTSTEFTTEAEPPSPGTIAFASATDSSVSVTGTAASGGVAPLVYSWHRSTTSGFTPGAGNVLAGQTSQNLTDSTVVAGTNYFYKRLVTDDDELTAETNQAPGRTWLAPFKFYAIGDSNTANTVGSYTPISACVEYLGRMRGPRTITGTNEAVGGRATKHYLPASAGGVWGIIEPILDDMDTDGVTWLSITLGTNDAALGEHASYATNIAAIVDYCVNTRGKKVVLGNAPYIKVGAYNEAETQTFNERLNAFTAVNAGLVDGENVIAGPDLFHYFGANQSLLHSDGVHMLASGVLAYGVMLAETFDEILFPDEAGTTSTNLFVIRRLVR